MAEVVDALLLRIPPVLHDLVRDYARRRSLSVNRAIRELLESHPEVHRISAAILQQASDIENVS